MPDTPKDPDALFEAIRVDHELETRQDQGLVELARHRWHWTIDEDNDARVSIRAYAARVGRNVSGIARMVNGYRDWTGVDRLVNTRSLADCIATAGSSEERATVIRAVAKATGISEGHARSSESRLIRDVRESATERAERNGTTFEDEVEHVAKVVAAGRQADRRKAQERRASKSQRLLNAEAKLATVIKSLRLLLQDATADDYTEGEIEMILTLLRQSRALLGMVEVKVTGEDSATDWDAELARLGGVS